MAALAGHVVDSSGSTVANAKVTITDTARQVVFTTQTDSSGRYDERHLIAGHYQVKIEAQGFKTVVSSVDVSVDSITTFDATLQPGAVSETVNVVDECPLLKTERTDVSTVLSTEQVNELPTFGRNFSQLLLVTPGTVQFCWGDTSTENPQSGLAVNANGQMFVGVNTILDGTDNRDFLYGNMLIVPNLDSIAETKVTTSSYDAEFGQISAALVTVSTKSGTDQWHGSGFFYRRSDATFARDPFLQTPTGPSHRQVHSAKLSGASLAGRSAARSSRTSCLFLATIRERAPITEDPHRLWFQRKPNAMATSARGRPTTPFSIRSVQAEPPDATTAFRTI